LTAHNCTGKQLAKNGGTTADTSTAVVSVTAATTLDLSCERQKVKKAKKAKKAKKKEVV
jgi:hypothetical protein